MKKVLIAVVLCLSMVIVVWSQAKKPAPAKAQTSSPAQASILRGKDVYSKLCITCHQKDGGGVPNLNPPLSKTSYVLGDKTKLVRIVLKGLNQPITIDDHDFVNPMPPQPQLSDAQIADVLTYVRNSFGNKASAISSAEVKAIRAKTK